MAGTSEPARKWLLLGYPTSYWLENTHTVPLLSILHINFSFNALHQNIMPKFRKNGYYRSETKFFLGLLGYATGHPSPSFSDNDQLLRGGILPRAEASGVNLSCHVGQVRWLLVGVLKQVQNRFMRLASDSILRQCSFSRVDFSSCMFEP